MSKSNEKTAQRAWFKTVRDHGLDAEARRDFQKKTCGKESATDMTESDFRSCSRALSGKPAFKPSHRPIIRKIHAIWGDLGHMKAVSGTSHALRAFCARMCNLQEPVTISPEHMTDEQANKVVLALKAMQARAKFNGDQNG